MEPIIIIIIIKDVQKCILHDRSPLNEWAQHRTNCETETLHLTHPTYCKEQYNNYLPNQTKKNDIITLYERLYWVNILPFIKVIFSSVCPGTTDKN